MAVERKNSAAFSFEGSEKKCIDIIYLAVMFIAKVIDNAINTTRSIIDPVEVGG